jgi:hypothetical protein
MKINFPFNPIAAASVSASLAVSSSFLNNIGTPIDSASVALNITGSAGTAGSNAVKTGVTGNRGETGDPAPDGLNAYLLLAERSTCGGCAAGTIPPDYITYPSTGCPPFWQFNSFTGCCFTTTPE